MTHAELVAWLAENRADAAALAGGGAPAAEPPPGPELDPEVTVAMPAFEAAPFVAEAAASVLAQRDVRLELVVVDDASTDDTAAIVGRIRDPRVRLVRNDRRRGIGHGHNRAVEVARAPAIAHVDADDVIVPGALRAMLDALASAPSAAQAYCNHYLVGADGAIDEAGFRSQRDFLETQRREHPDVRRALLRHGMVANTLRTYRRDALLDVGPFDESLEFAVDYEMALRIADRHDVVLVPEFLYCQRVHDANTQETMRWRALRSWRQRARICERLIRERGGLLGFGPLAARALLLAGLADAVEATLTTATSRRRGPG